MTIPVTTGLTCDQAQTCIEAVLGCVSPVASVLFCIRDIVVALIPPYSLSSVGKAAINCGLLFAPPFGFVIVYVFITAHHRY